MYSFTFPWPPFLLILMNFPDFSKIWYNTVPQKRQGLYHFALKLPHPVEGYFVVVIFGPKFVSVGDSFLAGFRPDLKLLWALMLTKPGIQAIPPQCGPPHHPSPAFPEIWLFNTWGTYVSLMTKIFFCYLFFFSSLFPFFFQTSLGKFKKKIKLLWVLAPFLI